MKKIVNRSTYTGYKGMQKLVRKSRHPLGTIAIPKPPMPTAAELKVKSETVTMTHTMDDHGWAFKAGDTIRISEIYSRNGETQIIGILNERICEVPAVWTDVEFL
jgi:hypothetical protein